MDSNNVRISTKNKAKLTAWKGDKSKCRCGHTGDGKGVSQHSGMLGHGACKKCHCTQFTWDGFLNSFTSYMGW